MALKDWIDRQAEIEKNRQISVQQFNKEIDRIEEEAIAQTAQQVYDAVCQSVAEKLSAGLSTVTGCVDQPCYTVGLVLTGDQDEVIYSEHKRLYNLKHPNAESDWQWMFEDIGYRYRCQYNALNRFGYDYKLELIKQTVVDSGYVPYLGTVDKIIRMTEGDAWNRYWTYLSDLAMKDKISLEFKIDLRLPDKKIEKLVHHAYAQFGETIKVFKSIFSGGYTVFPVVVYSFEK